MSDLLIASDLLKEHGFEELGQKLSARCKTCKYWFVPTKWDRSQDIQPRNPVTKDLLTEEEILAYYGYEVKQCNNPKIPFYEYPVKDGATVMDGSQYDARLVTASEFGCVLWEGK